MMDSIHLQSCCKNLKGKLFTPRELLNMLWILRLNLNYCKILPVYVKIINLQSLTHLYSRHTNILDFRNLVIPRQLQYCYLAGSTINRGQITSLAQNNRMCCISYI